MNPTIAGSSNNKVIKRFGGRHLIFRTDAGKKSVLPTPYALVSSFRGPDWFFFGIGQVFLTHEKMCEFERWGARIPRSGKARAKLEKLLMQMEPELNSFIRYCNEHGIEGTIVVDSSVIEFHWTFGQELKDEKLKDQHKSPLETKFKRLVEAYLGEKSSIF